MFRYLRLMPHTAFGVNLWASRHAIVDVRVVFSCVSEDVFRAEGDADALMCVANVCISPSKIMMKDHDDSQTLVWSGVCCAACINQNLPA